MRWVVDASVVIPCLLEEVHTARTRALLSSGGIFMAPALLRLEVTNALWKATRRGLLDQEQARRLIDLYGRMGIVELPNVRGGGDLLELCWALDHPVYDCAYLAAAVTTGSMLVTADEAFLRRLTGTRWSALATHLDEVVTQH